MGWLASLLAERVANEVARNPAQPRTQLVRLTQVAQMSPSREERFLGEVLALAQTPRGAVGQGANQGLVPRHDFTESLAVARQALGDQIGIV